MRRVYVFLILFSVVLFLEAIGSTYMMSAIQSIERQFQIPSKLSGFMVSASECALPEGNVKQKYLSHLRGYLIKGDFGYIPTVMLIAYFGSKGNRAKWIGAGTILTAFSFILIASPNFLFPTKQPQLNTTSIELRIKPSDLLLSPEATISDYLHYALIDDRSSVSDIKSAAMNITNEDIYSIDGTLLAKIMKNLNKILRDTEDDGQLKQLLIMYVNNRLNNSDEDVMNAKRIALAPFSFCSKLINEFRQIIKQTKCERNLSNFAPLLIMIAALILLGVGRTMPWSLGVPMIDDSVKRKSIPSYFAGISFIRILGPIAGLLIGSFCNKLYYTLKPPPGLTASDPTWIGAWWLGFLIVGISFTVPSFALFFFPTKGKQSQIAPDDVSSPERLSDAVNTKNKAEGELAFFDKHNDEGQHLTAEEKFNEIIKSKVYLGSVAGRVVDLLAMRGYFVFLPKYLENHYGLPQYKAHQFMALFGVSGFALGTVSGGFITRKLKLNGRRIAAFVFFISALNVLAFMIKAFLGCESTVNRVGLNGMITNFNYTSECNANCGCESAALFPVCDSEGYTYFSPCHAGCREVIVKDKSSHIPEFSSCDCSPGEILSKTYCKDNCTPVVIVYFITVMIGGFIGGNGIVPGMLILLRSVPPTDRSIALGLQGLFVSLLATLPSPLLWGAIFDSACLVWNYTCPGISGSCAIYDPAKLRIRVHALFVVIRSISVLTDLYVVYHASGLNVMEEEEKEEVIEPKESISLEPTNIVRQAF
ncbi:unnamed protein product [Anisakis simplex]|uniref:Solute carrier organic anion transporter family member n=1 Tax=Anisakis simplex TaxID=6269 RepID=A0A0M3JSP2_ANISI|nr:unnamed protein product [Anisakis simplex]